MATVSDDILAIEGYGSIVLIVVVPSRGEIRMLVIRVAHVPVLDYSSTVLFAGSG